ncbi:MAG: hypothetical protein P4L33_20740 [Capsulimonadaceae bacterium]|nr:hypothetical protein [Capsulimonadaceae bacterium]
MKSSNGNGNEGGGAFTILALGVIAGALAAYLVQLVRAEQAPIAGNPAGEASGPDLLRRAAQKLRENRDKIVDAVERDSAV